MTTRINVAGRVRAFREYATKNGATGEQVAVALKSSEETVRRVANLGATPEEIAEISAGLERVAVLARQDIERQQNGEVARKSDSGSETPRSNRDSIGRTVTKPYGRSPRDIRARESARADRSGERLPDGRSRKKMYS